MTPSKFANGADPAEEAAQWAARLSSGRLSSQDEVEFQAWLDADPQNAQTLDEIVGAWRAVEAYASTPELLDLRERALASARQACRARSRRRIMDRSGRWTALAASFALIVAISAAAVWLSPRVYETGIGERRVVALSDGSKVSLDADTKVLVRYAFGRRRLWLERGRAKFDVAKDPLHPFTVDAAGREVVATGTSFSVERLRNQVCVILYEGRVAVLDDVAGKPRRELIAASPVREPADRVLTPGRELVAAAADPVNAVEPPTARVVPVDPVRTLAWEAGELVFEDEPLSTAIERFNRYASTPLVLEDDAVARIRISGVFRAGDTDAFIQGLTAVFPVRARAQGDHIALSKDAGRASRAG